jgi:hypothetical protein
VRTPEGYDIDLACLEAGSFKDEWNDTQNGKKHPALEVDLDLRIVHGDDVQLHSVLTSLHRGWWSQGTVGWILGDVHLSPGKYELVITNQKDLSRLRSANPTVLMKINSLDMKDRAIDHSLGLVVGAPIRG